MTQGKINMTAGGLDQLLASLSQEDDGLHKSASQVATEEVDMESEVANKLKSVLTKQASSNLTGENNTMSNGQDLSASILALIKQAETGNNVIDETDEMVAADEERDELTPVDGLTITETARAIAQRAAANGAEVVGDHQDEADAEGEAQLDESDVEPSELDKQAALGELVAQGFDFEEAANLVKEACENITAGLQKSAAVRSLIDEGYGFAEAVELVKQASATADAAETYSELEKAAAVSELVGRGYPMEEAVALVKEAAALPMIRAAVPAVVSGAKKGLSRKAKVAIGAGAAALGAGAVGGALVARKKQQAAQ